MWAAIASSAAVLAVLLRRGWGPGAWVVAAAVIAVSCAAVCAWFIVIAGRSARAQERARELAEARRSAGQPPRSAITGDDAPEPRRSLGR